MLSLKSANGESTRIFLFTEKMFHCLAQCVIHMHANNGSHLFDACIASCTCAIQFTCIIIHVYMYVHVASIGLEIQFVSILVYGDVFHLIVCSVSSHSMLCVLYRVNYLNDNPIFIIAQRQFGQSDWTKRNRVGVY